MEGGFEGGEILGVNEGGWRGRGRGGRSGFCDGGGGGATGGGGGGGRRRRRRNVSRRLRRRGSG